MLSIISFYYNLTKENQEIVVRLNQEIFTEEKLTKFLEYLILENIGASSQLNQEQAQQLALDNYLERLSELEKTVINWLANQNQSINIAIKPADFQVSKAKFLQVIQSLTRRCLIEKVVNGESTHFQLNPIFKAYVLANENIL